MEKIVDNGVNMSNNLSVLLKEKVTLRVFIDLFPLLETGVYSKFKTG